MPQILTWAFGFSASQPTNFSGIRYDILELKGDNYKMWKKRIFLYLGWMDIDFAN
jgi:hypothetical protein